MTPRLCLAFLLAFAGINSQAASAAAEDKLCEVLGRITAGEQIPVTLTGIYAVSYENQIFYDPDTPSCAMDVQPMTWLEFSPSFKDDPRFDQHIRADRRVWGTFTGVLWGPGKVSPDDLSAPVMIAYANRIANRRYGHMNAFRTRFVVDTVRDIRPVSMDMASYGSWAALRVRNDIPRLIAAQLPQYPPAAQNVGIEGPVVIDATVVGGIVQGTNVRIGDRVLADAVRSILATWRFEPTVNATFTSTFLFELRRTRTGADRNPEMDLQSADLRTDKRADERLVRQGLLAKRAPPTLAASWPSQRARKGKRSCARAKAVPRLPPGHRKS